MASMIWNCLSVSDVQHGTKKTDTYLVLGLDSLGIGLALLGGELGNVLAGLLSISRLLVDDNLVLLVALEIAAEPGNLVLELVGNGLDGHTGCMPSHGEQSTLTLHTSDLEQSI